MHVLSLKAALERRGLEIPARVDGVAKGADTPKGAESPASLQAAKPALQPRPLLARAGKRAVDLPRFLSRP